MRDALLSDDPLPCTPATLGVGQRATCGPVTYTVTADDEAAGSVRNVATATATDPDGDPVESPEDSTSTPVTLPQPAVTITKTHEVDDVNASTITDAGDEITYRFTVTNTGNVPVLTW